MIKVRTPGKLFIAGEYAVTEPGHPAILVAVDRFINISIEAALDKGTISSYANKRVSWTRKDGQIRLEESKDDFSYILSAMGVVEAYVGEMGKEPSYYDIEVDSQLEEADGRKYGLGSSSAVTVGVVEGLCQFYGLSISDEKRFKLAALANIIINKTGSCGDIAACSYGGWISFTSFDNDWVFDKLKEEGLVQLLDQDWPGLKIERLDPPRDMELVVGWTGAPASTAKLVERIKLEKINQGQIYEKFLEESKILVEAIIEGFKKNNTDEIKAGINRNGQLLAKLGKDFGVEIETAKLKELSTIAQSHRGGTKTSGAGGGDCGIGIFGAMEDLARLIRDWEDLGIVHLDLIPYEK